MSYSYIYKITNTITGSLYIGQTTQNNINTRFRQHISDSKRSSNRLSKAINKYGPDNFIIEEVHREKGASKKRLDELEVYYIKKYNSTNLGNYNSREGGSTGSNVNGKYGKELAATIALDIELEDKTFSEIARLREVPRSYVSDINCGEIFPNLRSSYPISERLFRREFSEDEILDVHRRLKGGESSKYISELYGVSVTSISNINLGKTYRLEGVEYPVKRAINSKERLNVKEVEAIVNLLESGKSYTEIGNTTPFPRKTVANIDKGLSYKHLLKELNVCDFPIKK